MKFKITRANENKFESGLRGFFEYKNLGIEEATSGKFGANVIKAIDLFIKNLNSFKRDINFKNNKALLQKLIQTKKVRSKIIKLKQDTDKPDFGRVN